MSRPGRERAGRDGRWRPRPDVSGGGGRGPGRNGGNTGLPGPQPSRRTWKGRRPEAAEPRGRGGRTRTARAHRAGRPFAAGGASALTRRCRARRGRCPVVGRTAAGPPRTRCGVGPAQSRKGTHGRFPDHTVTDTDRPRATRHRDPGAAAGGLRLRLRMQLRLPERRLLPVRRQLRLSVTDARPSLAPADPRAPGPPADRSDGSRAVARSNGHDARAPAGPVTYGPVSGAGPVRPRRPRGTGQPTAAGTGTEEHGWAPAEEEPAGARV